MYDHFKLTETQRIISPSRASYEAPILSALGKMTTGYQKLSCAFFPLIYTIYAILHLVIPVLRILTLWLLKNSATHDITVTLVVNHAVTFSRKVSVRSNILGVTDSRDVGKGSQVAEPYINVNCLLRTFHHTWGALQVSSRVSIRRGRVHGDTFVLQYDSSKWLDNSSLSMMRSRHKYFIF